MQIGNDVKITFLGAAGTVTGSKTLIETRNYRVLVDCGLFQGIKDLRNLNWASFPIRPDKIDAIILTHAHLDHCGYLPVLVKNGFKGPIHCTHATRELSEIILKDSAKIQEEDAQRANEYKYSSHKKALPLYTIQEAIDTFDQFVGHDYHEWTILNEDFKFSLINNGHILGSAMVDLHVNSKKVLFSGDMGRTKPMLLYPPKKIKEADYLILESTYGDRLHQDEQLTHQLEKVINETYERRGILMIPSFAVERTQEMIYLLHQLKEKGALPKIPIYLDSPMGINSTKVYEKYNELQNIPRFELNHMYDFIHFISDYDASCEIVEDDNPKIVLAGSGMLEGGRIIHYLHKHGANSNNTLLFVGYQSEGTRGRALMEGSKEIKFFGEYRPINCQIKSFSSMSCHADQSELLEWLGHFSKFPSKIFLNHGEPHQRDALRVKIKDNFATEVITPNMNSEYKLD